MDKDALKSHKNIISNDLEYYAYALWLNLTRLLISTFHAMIVTDEN